MLLSQLIDQNVYANERLRGRCLGVGISLKNFSAKYLLCQAVQSETARRALTPQADFAVSVSSVSEFSENGINVSKLRPVFPKNCAKIFLPRPIYSYEGAFLGQAIDLELSSYVATRLFTDRNEIIPISSISAFSDAVILRKEQAYPLGQRIPAHVVSNFCDKNEPIVTKSILKMAIAKKKLIRFTMSLSPFRQDLEIHSKS